MFPPAEAGACIITKRVVLNNFALHKLIHSIDKSPIMPKCDNPSFFFSKPNVMDHPYQMIRKKYTKCAKQRKEWTKSLKCPYTMR